MLKNRLKSYRHKLEMNQTEFAAHIGASVYMYNCWERQRRQPTLLWALKIAKKLNCHVEDMFEFEDE